MPGLLAVTTPVELTVAIVVLDEVHGSKDAAVPCPERLEVPCTHAFGVPEILHCAQPAVVTVKNNNTTSTHRKPVLLVAGPPEITFFEINDTD